MINLISDSPQQSPITIVTSNSPKDFMAQQGPRKKSMDLIVQKIKRTKEEKAQPSKKPERAEHEGNINEDPTRSINEAPEPSYKGNEPLREPTRENVTDYKTHPKMDDMTIIIIPDSPNSKTTILIDSDEDHPTTPKAPIMAPMQLQIAAESTRIFQQPSPQQIPPSMEHVISGDEHTAHKDEVAHASPASAYSTAPSEIPPTAIQNASPNSSLDADILSA